MERPRENVEVDRIVSICPATCDSRAAYHVPAARSESAVFVQLLGTLAEISGGGHLWPRHRERARPESRSLAAPTPISSPSPSGSRGPARPCSARTSTWASAAKAPTRPSPRGCAALRSLMIAKVGKDLFGEGDLRNFNSFGIDTTHVASSRTRPPVWRRSLSSPADKTASSSSRGRMTSLRPA